MGLAIGVSQIAEPLEVIRFESQKKAIQKIKKVVKEEGIGDIVVGVSEGKMGQESRRFGEKLRDKVDLPVHYQDETLTTKEAQELSLKAGIKRKKRHRLEDAYSAALILQNYLDMHWS